MDIGNRLQSIGCGHDSVTELLSRARRAIESGEASLRAAAEDIAVAQEQGATQRQIGKPSASLPRR